MFVCMKPETIFSGLSLKFSWLKFSFEIFEEKIRHFLSLNVNDKSLSDFEI
jgi:hypothetical protein